MKDEYIKSFYKEVNQALEGNYKIILEPGQAARRTGYELQDSRGNAEDRAASSQVADGRGVYGVGRRGVTLQGDHRPCGERR